MENLNTPEVRTSPASPDAINFTVHLQRGERDFGLNIIGGQGEGIQVTINGIVPGGPADLNGDVQQGDEIHYVDGINVTGFTRDRVVSLMRNAALAGEVTLGMHRKLGKLTHSGMLRSRSAEPSLSWSQGECLGSGAFGKVLFGHIKICP